MLAYLPINQLLSRFARASFGKRTAYLVKVDRVSTKGVMEEPESELVAKLKKRYGAYGRSRMWLIPAANYFIGVV